MASRRGPDNSVRVALSGLGQGNPWAVVMHAQLATSSAIIQADLDFWLDAFADAFFARFTARVGSGVTLTQAQATLYTPGGGQLSSSEARADTFTGGTAVLDTAASEVVSWLSTVYWRGGKPRTYLPVAPSANITSGHSLSAGEITALQTAGTNFIADINALTHGTITGTVFGFISFRSLNAERIPPLFFPITGARAHSRLGTQRRRLGRWVA